MKILKMLSKLFKILGFIVFIAMPVTEIVFRHDANVDEYVILYEVPIFLLFCFLKYIVDTKILERRIKKEMHKIKEIEQEEQVVKILNELLTWLVGIAFFANVMTLILGIFYFFDFFLFKLWIAELVTTFVIVGIKVHVSYMIFESEIKD